MSFNRNQTRALSAKLQSEYVRTRNKNGKTLSFVEGWYVIAEANRVFGFDSWDRQTLLTRCVWETIDGRDYLCSYVARVRIKVRAGETIISRDGTGSGSGRGMNPAEAHEAAIKEAETDAMKRALITFGNPFGLALYDQEQRWVERAVTTERPIVWQILGAAGLIAKHEDPVTFCGHMRKVIEAAVDIENLKKVWNPNRAQLAFLRRHFPGLVAKNGRHFADILCDLYRKRLSELATSDEQPPASVAAASEKTTQTSAIARGSERGPAATDTNATIRSNALIKARPALVRDRDHLEYVARQACLVCGQAPSQAHHVRFAQPRAMGRKASDEFTVPLCAVHHRDLHDHGDERAWWRDKLIEPLRHAESLWTETVRVRRRSPQVETDAEALQSAASGE